jgi:hypothetical protein
VTRRVITELRCLDLITRRGYWWDSWVAGDGFHHGFLGVGCVLLVDILLFRMVGGLVDLLFAGRIGLQMGNAAVDTITAATGLPRPQLAGASSPCKSPLAQIVASRIGGDP